MRCRMAWRVFIRVSTFPHDPPTEIVNRADARMPRLFFHVGAMSMTRPLLALGLFLAVSAMLAATGATPMAIGAARADEIPPAGCSFAGASFLSQADLGDVTINCTGLSEAFGRQLTEILTRILKNRL